MLCLLACILRITALNTDPNFSPPEVKPHLMKTFHAWTVNDHIFVNRPSCYIKSPTVQDVGSISKDGLRYTQTHLCVVATSSCTKPLTATHIPNNGARTKSLNTRLSAGISNLEVYGPLTVMHSRNTTSPQDTTILHLWHIKIIIFGRWMWHAGTSPPNPLSKLLVSKRNRLSSILTPTRPSLSLYLYQTPTMFCTVILPYPPSIFTLHPPYFPPFPHTILHLYHITLYRSLFLEDGCGVQGPPLPTSSQTSVLV